MFNHIHLCLLMLRSVFNIEALLFRDRALETMMRDSALSLCYHAPTSCVQGEAQALACSGYITWIVK